MRRDLAGLPMRILFLTFFLADSGLVLAQTAWFVDGFHGGMYGHYPDSVTGFIVEQLEKHPEWSICLEIEPDTWDRVRLRTPEAYETFKALVEGEQTRHRIEFVNPSYAQSYCWNIGGESLIRQFTLGMAKTAEHFPNAKVVTYSSEEPCFTSALPGILKSLGFKNAVLKNPNTCWGGYTRAFGGELVNWIGPDGTSLPTVPRYSSEELRPNKTWETTASRNGKEYIEAALRQGIQHPVGMCLQDAGWQNGPWLGNNRRGYRPTEYITWRNYFENVAIRSTEQDWRFSQEDVLVSLVWGSQVLQRIAQQARSAENKILQAEKLAALASLVTGATWPQEDFDEAWPPLLLSQHHDCWIVPYNGRRRNTWADKVGRWTESTREISARVTRQSVAALSEPSEEGSAKRIQVINTTGTPREELVDILLPSTWKPERVAVIDSQGETALSQRVASSDGNRESRLLFKAAAPAFGQSWYNVQEEGNEIQEGAVVRRTEDNACRIETDRYTLVLNGSRGGTCDSLRTKSLPSQEWIDARNDRRFGEIRGYFFEDHAFASSAEQPATFEILEEGPLRVQVRIKGLIATHPFVKMITLVQGQDRIDFDLTIDWQGSPGIGDEYAQQERWVDEDYRKAFYDDRFKLQVVFPTSLKSSRIFKNAAFDVTESKLTDTFFQTWDNIKHNIIVNWVDAFDASDNRGLTLLSDHTTSYVHGREHPLGLTLQYSGIGLWGRRYRIDGPTRVRYAVIPHGGDWKAGGISTASNQWNEPLIGIPSTAREKNVPAPRSMIDLKGTGWELVSATFEDSDLLIRLFNAEGDDRSRSFHLGITSDHAQWIELDGTPVNDVTITTDDENSSIIRAAIPEFGVRTLRFSNVRTLPL